MAKLPLVANLTFIMAILFSRFSGNDKAPALVLYAVAIALFIFIFLLIREQWRLSLVAALPLVYFFSVIMLSRHGWIDSISFIGFR